MRFVFAGLLLAMLITAASAEDCIGSPASVAICRCGAAWNAKLKCDEARAEDNVGKPQIKRTRLDYRCFMYDCLASKAGQRARGTSACPIGQPDTGQC